MPRLSEQLWGTCAAKGDAGAFVHSQEVKIVLCIKGQECELHAGSPNGRDDSREVLVAGIVESAHGSLFAPPLDWGDARAHVGICIFAFCVGEGPRTALRFYTRGQEKHEDPSSHGESHRDS